MSEKKQARPVYVVDCSVMHDRDSVHAELEAALPLPSYYGCNLDALWDSLWELDPCEIILADAHLLESPDSELGEYGESLLSTFEDAAEEVPDLSVRRIER